MAWLLPALALGREIIAPLAAALALAALTLFRLLERRPLQTK